MFKKFIKSSVFKDVVFFGLPVVITFRDNVLTFSAISGNSMQPTLNADPRHLDIVLVDKWSANSYQISRGDVVVFKSPMHPEVEFLKRIKGLENDNVQVKSHKYATDIRVPKGHCWVEGDNADHSYDSRSFGSIPLGLITGKAIHVVWPPHHWKPVT